MLGVLALWRIRPIQRLQITQVRNVGAPAQCVHLVGYALGKVSALDTVADPVLDLSERRARGVEIGLLRLVQELREPFGLISADRRNRVAEVAREAEISSGRSAFSCVRDDQLSELIGEPPTIQILDSACHAGGNGRNRASVDCQEFQVNLWVCLDLIRTDLRIRVALHPHP